MMGGVVVYMSREEYEDLMASQRPTSERQA